MDNYELCLYHHGVKGMKWGVRRSRRSTAKKKYRKRVDDAFNTYEKTISNIEKPYRRGQNLSTKDQAREAAAEKRYRDTVTKAKSDYKAVKKAERKATVEEIRNKAVKTAGKGAKVASKLALYSTIDDVFYGGVGKKIAKETIVNTGRAAITAFMMARGDYDIKWYDKQGRRVG